MRKERRWMTSVLKESAKQKIDMPWARGPRRAAWIAKRSAQTTNQAARA